MKIVNFVEYTSTGTEVVATVTEDWVWKGDPLVIENLKEFISKYPDSIYPNAGFPYPKEIKTLDDLPFAFHGTYFWASMPQDV